MLWIGLIALIALVALVVRVMGVRFEDNERGHERRFLARLHRVWRRASTDLGLEFDSSGESGWSITGLIEGFDVTVTVTRTKMSSQTISFMTYVISGRGRIPRSLKLQPQTPSLFGGDHAGADRILIGDPDFDAQVEARGPRRTVLAILSESARNELAATFKLLSKVKVEDGALIGKRSGILNDPDNIVAMIQYLVDVAGRLAVPTDRFPKRLARNAKKDPRPEVRRRNLEALRDAPNTLELSESTARRALGDPDASVRVEAALGLGWNDLEPLLELAGSEPDLRARARILLHVSGFAEKRVGPMVEAALASEDVELSRAAITAAARSRQTELIGAIVSRAATGDDATTIAAAQALGELGGAESERALMALLEHSATEVRMNAVGALGLAGSVASVEPLRACSDKAGLLNRDLKHAAIAAIAAIQSRLGHVEDGTLSLADVDPTAGAVSVVTDTTDGALSLAPGDVPESRRNAR